VAGPRVPPSNRARLAVMENETQVGDHVALSVDRAGVRDGVVARLGTSYRTTAEATLCAGD